MTVSTVPPQAHIAEVLDGLGVEILTAKRKVDALVVADALRHLASQCERIAEELPEGGGK